MPDLIFFEDEIKSLSNIIDVTLIDHNKLDQTQEALLGSKVTKIVDHHVDNNMYSGQLVDKQIELIGSATTLVIERLLKEFPDSIDAELAHFLKAPIVLDSYNFEPTLKESKWTDKDMAVYKRLDELSSGLEDGKMQFERLFNAITDVTMNLKLGFQSLLIKDFKTYYLLNQGQTGIGLGTIHVPLKVMIESYDLETMKKSMSELIATRKLAYYGILTNCRDSQTGEYRKEVLLYHPQAESVD